MAGAPTPEALDESDAARTLVVGATRLGVGIALVGAAGVGALVDPAPEAGTEDARPAQPADLGAFLVAVALLTAIRIDRGAAAALRFARTIARTAVTVGHLTPLGGWIERARALVEAQADRGRGEAEASIDRVLDAWDALLEAVVGQVLRHLDVNEIARSIDLNEIASEIDVNAVAARVDVDRLVDQIDIDRIAQRLDVEAIVNRLDLASIARGVLDEIGVEEIIRESSGSLTVQTVDALRARGVDADRRLAELVDRALFRHRGRDVRLASSQLTEEASTAGDPP
jgi:hypothetical protein